MKVVCIRDDWGRTDGVTYPKKGMVLTVRSISVVGNLRGYLFQEIINPVMHWSNGTMEAAFHVGYFRPVTDITDLIKLTKVRELEDV